MGFFARLFGRTPRPTRSDPFFGTLRYRRDHWLGAAPDRTGALIEVMLIGPVEMSSLDRQRHRYEELLQRLPGIVEAARTLIESFAYEQFDAVPSPRFFRECELIHCVLPDPDDSEIAWDISVSGPWPGFRERGSDVDPDNNFADFVLELRDWQPVSVDLA